MSRERRAPHHLHVRCRKEKIRLMRKVVLALSWIEIASPSRSGRGNDLGPGRRGRQFLFVDSGLDFTIDFPAYQ